MNRNLLLLLVMLSFLMTGCSASRHAGNMRSISPIEYGLNKARLGEERFQVLYKTHTAAISSGAVVSYKGIKSIDVVIPKDAKSIPLTTVNDFAGVEFNVKNTQKDFYLFTYAAKATPIKVSKQDIDGGSFKRYPQLKKGRVLLVISDENPWVQNRQGYKYGHVRKDILLLKNGKAQNKTVMPYNNAASSPTCTYYLVTDKGLAFSNITLNRSKDSSKKTYLVSVAGVDGLTLSGVTIHTPENQGQSDAAISIKECTNVTFKDVTIDGTYSRKDYSGYGVSLNTIWIFKATNMIGHGNWGVFGTNNVNVASFEDSEINRFDIHCYGRDVSFQNVRFVDLYNQFSSVFGAIRFIDCVFDDFTPVLFETSYNTYVPVDIYFSNCKFNLTKGHNYLIRAGRIDGTDNERTELRGKYWPNVYIDGLTVSVPNDVSEAYVFLVSGNKVGEIDGFDAIRMKDVTFKYASERTPITFSLTNGDVTTKSSVDIQMEGVNDGEQSMPLRININRKNDKNRLSVSRSRIIQK